MGLETRLIMTRRGSLGGGTLPAAPPAEENADWRNIKCGRDIPREGYRDQPYVVITRDGNWLCVLTTGRGAEGRYPGRVRVQMTPTITVARG
jgi:hypothetical protein